LFALAVGVAPAVAAPVDVVVTLTPTALSGSPFGITALPAGPFVATLSFSGALPANALIQTAGLGFAGFTGFSLTIGDTTFSETPIVFLTTDSTGAVSLLRFGFSTPELTPRGFSVDVPSDASNVQWYASDSTGCGFSQLPLQVFGDCIAGEPGSASLATITRGPTDVPASGALTLLLAGVAAMSAAMHARRARPTARGSAPVTARA